MPLLRVYTYHPSTGRSGISSRSLLRGVISDREGEGGTKVCAARGLVGANSARGTRAANSRVRRGAAAGRKAVDDRARPNKQRNASV